MENPYELLYMCRCGDEWSQAALFRQYIPLLKAEISRVLHSYARMEIYRDDLLQEAVLCIPHAEETYRSDQNCSFATFLAVIARRKIFSMLRHYSAATYVQMHNTTALDGMVSESGAPYEVMDDRNPMHNPEYHYQFVAAAERLQELISTMNEREREVLEAWYRHMPYTEASAKLGIPFKAYDGRLQRVKGKVINAVLGENPARRKKSGK